VHLVGFIIRSCLIHWTVTSRETIGNPAALLHTNAHCIKEAFYTLILLHDNRPIRTEICRS
jgi:hypothetical protein